MPQGTIAAAAERVRANSSNAAVTTEEKEQPSMIRARESKSAPVGVVGKVLRSLEALDAAPTGLQLRALFQIVHASEKSLCASCSKATRWMTRRRISGHDVSPLQCSTKAAKLRPPSVFPVQLRA